MNSPKKSSS